VKFAVGEMYSNHQKYVLHAQTNPTPTLALTRWTHLQPDRSLLDRRGHFYKRMNDVGRRPFEPQVALC
jgi:hypothetical protein